MMLLRGLFVLSLMYASVAQAQSVGPRPEALRAGISASPDAFADSVTASIGSASDYRWEGAIAGAVVFGAFGLFAASLADEDSGGSASPVVFGFVGALVGAGIGALIGGAIHKD